MKILTGKKYRELLRSISDQKSDIEQLEFRCRRLELKIEGGFSVMKPETNQLINKRSKPRRRSGK